MLIIKLELKNIFRNRFLLTLSVLLFVFIGVSLYYGKARTDRQNAILADLKTKETDFYREKRLLLDSIERKLRDSVASSIWYQDPSNPLVVSAFRGAGVYAQLPPAPMASFSKGQSDIFPFYAKVYLGGNTLDESLEFENPFHAALGDFDLSFVLVFILPLLVIAFSYNLLSAEREQGTLPLVLSTPVRLWVWLLRKIVLRLLLLAGIVVGSIVLFLFLFEIKISLSLLVPFFLGLLLYVFFWFGLAFGVNIWKKSSSFNVNFLLACWLFAALLIPNFLSLLATQRYPTPSRLDYLTQKRAIEVEVEKKHDQIVEAYYTQNPELRPADSLPKTWKNWWHEGLAVRQYQASALEKITQHFESQAQSQRLLAKKFEWLSPALVFQSFLNRLAQTDSETYLHFNAQVKAFEKEWSAFFIAKFQKEEALTSRDYDQFPAFKP